MFEALAEAVDGVEIPAYGEAIAEAIAIRERLDAAISEAVGRFDADGGWELEGATSMTAWLRLHGRLTSRDATRLATTGRRLRRLPVTAAAYGHGELSGGQVAAILANLSDRTAALFAGHECEVVEHLARLSVGGVARAMQVWRQRAEATLDDPEEAKAPRRELHHSQTLDGRWECTASFDAHGGGVVDAALDLAASPDAEGEPRRSPAQRRADALVDLCQWFVDHYPAGAKRARRPDLDVVIDLGDLDTGLGALAQGTPLEVTTVKRLLCDAGVHRFITDGASSVLDYGRATRTIPPQLWAALVLRDGHCRHPGCDRKPEWCEGHHIRPWSHGGTTDLSNLVLGCSRHHHLWHLPGWHLKLRPDGELHLTMPNGRVLLSPPPTAGS